MVICDFFSSFVFFDSLVSSHNILIYPSSSTIVEAFPLQSSLRIKYTLACHGDHHRVLCSVPSHKSYFYSSRPQQLRHCDGKAHGK
jgi:hypothetical protein